MSCIYNLGLLLNTSCVFTNLLRPRPHVSGHFWIRNFCSRPQSEPRARIRNFLNLLSRVEILNTLWIWNRVDASPDSFWSRDQTRTSPVLYREGQSKIRAFYDACSVANIPRGVLQWIGYVWKGKFDLNMDTRGRGNVWNWRENLRALARDKTRRRNPMLMNENNRVCSKELRS